MVVMEETKQKIARNLDAQFAAMGFAAPGVDALREGADVSLRTLYKYYRSREAMVAGALEHRNEVYLAWISGGPESGPEHILYVFEKLGEWLGQVANTGCLFLNALAAYPDDPNVRAIAEHHKDCVRRDFAARLARIAPGAETAELSEALLTIHEGQTDTAMVRGPEIATKSALRLARALLKSEGLL